MDLKEIKFPVMNCINMVLDVARWTDFVNIVMRIRLLYKEGNFTIDETGGSRSVVTGMRHLIDW